MRIGFYVRVSTQDQSCDLQKNDLIEYCNKRGWPDFAIYEDKATGTNGNRPMLKQLLRDARERKIDLIVCWKLDRLFRSLKDLLVTLQDLTDLGVEFVSLRDNIDLTTSTGRLMMHILAAFGEFEASLIKERVRAGLKAARTKGTKLGRPIIIDVESVRLLRSQGLSITDIARRLGVSRSGVHKTLLGNRKNETLTL